MSMSNKTLREEIKRLEKALGIANRTVLEQMQELSRVIKINDIYFDTIKEQNVIIKYLEGKDV